MAKFCNMCGKPLEEGQVCDCQTQPQTAENQGEYVAPEQAVTQPQNQGQFAQGQQQFNGGQFNGGQFNGAQFNAQPYNQGPSAAGDFFNKVLGIVKNPVEGARNLAYSGNNAESFILLGVGAVLYLLGLILCMFKLNNKLGDAAKEMKLPYVKYVIMILVMLVICDIVVGAMLFVGTKIVDKTSNVNFTPVWAVVGVKSVYKGLGILAGSIVLLVLPWVGFAIMLAGTLVSFVLCANSFCAIMQIDPVKATYIQMIAITVATFIALFCTYMVVETAKDDIVIAAIGAAFSGLKY